jgi:hypothetical protein
MFAGLSLEKVHYPARRMFRVPRNADHLRLAIDPDRRRSCIAPANNVVFSTKRKTRTQIQNDGLGYVRQPPGNPFRFAACKLERVVKRPLRRRNNRDFASRGMNLYNEPARSGIEPHRHFDRTPIDPQQLATRWLHLGGPGSRIRHELPTPLTHASHTRYSKLTSTRLFFAFNATPDMRVHPKETDKLPGERGRRATDAGSI